MWARGSSSSPGGRAGRGEGCGRPGLRAAVSRLCSRVPPRGGAGPSQNVLLGVLHPLQVRGRGAGGRVGRAVPCFPLPPAAACGTGRGQVPDERARPRGPRPRPHDRGRGTHTRLQRGVRGAGDPRGARRPPRTPWATAGHSRLRVAWDPGLSDHLERPCLSNRMVRVRFQNPRWGRGVCQRPEHLALGGAVSHTVSKPVSVKVTNQCDLQIIH